MNLFEKLLGYLNIDNYNLVMSLYDKSYTSCEVEFIERERHLIETYSKEKSLTYETSTDNIYNAVHLIRSHHFYFYELLLKELTKTDLNTILSQIKITENIFTVNDLRYIDIAIYNLKDDCGNRRYIRFVKGYAGIFELSIGLSINSKLNLKSEVVILSLLKLSPKDKNKFFQEKAKQHRYKVNDINQILFVPLHPSKNLGHCMWNTIGGLIKYEKHGVYKKLFEKGIYSSILNTKGDFLDSDGFLNYLLANSGINKQTVVDISKNRNNKNSKLEMQSLFMPIDTMHRYSEYYNTYRDYLDENYAKSKSEHENKSPKKIILSIKGNNKQIPMDLQIEITARIITIINNTFKYKIEYIIEGVTKDLLISSSPLFEKFLKNETLMYENILSRIDDKQNRLINIMGLNVHEKHKFYKSAKVSFVFGGSSAITHSYCYEFPIITLWYKKHPPSRMSRPCYAWGDELTPINRKYMDEYSIWTNNLESDEFKSACANISLAIMDYIFKPSPMSLVMTSINK